MGKYAELGTRLSRRSGMSWSATFEELTGLVPGGLPASAYEYKAWWANDSDHVQAQAWMSAGWRTQDVDLHARSLTFVRA